MDLMRPVHAFDRAQQRHRGLAVPVAVVKKFGDDQAGGQAALIAYYGFFSLFPLLLLFVTVLGFVLQGDTSAQHTVSNSVLGQFPIIGSDLQRNVHAIHGQTLGLVVGIAGALLGGLGVTNAAQNAFDRVWAVPFKDRPDFLHKRLRGIGLLAALGTLFVLTWWRRGRLPRSRWFYRALVAAGPLSVVALLAGWVTTEVGRQPWVVYGILRTENAVTNAAGLPVIFFLMVAVYAALAIMASGMVRRLGARPARPELEAVEAP